MMACDKSQMMVFDKLQMKACDKLQMKACDKFLTTEHNNKIINLLKSWI